MHKQNKPVFIDINSTFISIFREGCFSAHLRGRERMRIRGEKERKKKKK